MNFPYRNIVVLTGAGISLSLVFKHFALKMVSGRITALRTLQHPKGLLAIPILFNRSIINVEKTTRRRYQANAAHIALGRLEEQLEGKVTIITQNIDNLHERGGSANIIHMHGELLKARCSESNQVIEHSEDIETGELCHCCQIPAQMRPHIVWFGEMPLRMGEIYAALEEADLFISIGTSGVVYPAAGFVHDAKMHGAHTIEINLEPSAVESEFEEKRYGKASIEVPKLVDEILALENETST